MNRLFYFGLAFWTVSLANTDLSQAVSRDEGKKADGSSNPTMAISRIVRQEGLKASKGCFSFVDEDAVSYRKRRWRKALDRIDAAEPGYVIKWIIGAVPPPEEVVAESTFQLRCVLGSMLRDAEITDSPLLLELGRSSTDKHTMKVHARRFAKDRSYRKRLLSKMIISGYRDGREQGSIWKRKWRFVGRRFNRISRHAAELCRLREGHAWDPSNERHIACWSSRLDGSARQQEILVASSAPGLSRHHWGTDFDLFSLNPKRFGPRGLYRDEYHWLLRNGVAFGFFQPYTSDPGRGGYMEERWHWSYFPIGQALLEYAREHEPSIQRELSKQWTGMEDRWNRRKGHHERYFDWIEKHWRSFVFEVDRGPSQR